MSEAISKLPTILLAGILLLIFASMRRQNPTLRFRLWLYAWILIFVRFCLQLWTETAGTHSNLYLVTDLAILQVAGILFLVSVSTAAERRVAPYTLIGVMAGPMVFYAAAMVYGFAPPWVYALCMFTVALGGCAHGFYVAGRNLWNFSVLAVLLALAAWGSVEAYRGHPGAGFHAFMSFMYAFAGALFLRKFRRLSAGVVTTSAGFLGWAAVGTIAYWNMETPSRLPEDIAIWALPKFVVAIGMIVTLLEDERLVTEQARFRERLLNQQMKSFAELTSSLLGGVDVAAVAERVAKVLSQTTNYKSTAVLLIQANGNFSVAGHCGFDQHMLRQLQEETEKLDGDSGASVLLAGEPVGENSYGSSLLKSEDSGASIGRS